MIPRHHTGPRRRTALAAVCLLAAASAAAVDRIDLDLGHVAGDGWHAEDLSLSLRLGRGGRPAGTVRVARLTLDGPLGTVTDLRLDCPRLRLTRHDLSCPDGRLTFRHPALTADRVPAAFRYERADGALHLEADGLTAGFSSADGRQAAQALRFAIILDLIPEDRDLRFDLTLDIQAGQAYSDPVFVDFDAHPARLHARGRLTPDALRVTAFRFEQPGVAVASGGLRLAREDWTPASVDLRELRAQLPAAYDYYLQPFLIGTPLDSLRTAGRIEGRLSLDADGPAAIALTGRNLTLADTRERFRLADADLALNWTRDGEPAAASVSRLSWDSAALGRIDIGASSLALRAGGDALRLTEPARFPLLGGALELSALSGTGLAGPRPELRLDARLTPIDLERLGRALDWPAFGGTLSGRIPELTYDDGVVRLAGGLTAEVFDGTVSVRSLRLEDPLGLRPRAELDAEARGLDLAAVTHAFDFGRIEGRLDADVTGLRLIGWQPVAFDAWLRTPPDDDSRHRISQRAIDNLASLGGGPGAGVLSRGFFKLFESFAYDRIGLGCRLARGVCRMRGLAPAEDGGYYIVRGQWLPRIDVIGHNREVSWPVLIRQLQSVTATQGPVIR